MSIARKIVANTVALIISSILGNGTTLLITLYIARHLGPSLYGEFSFTIALVSFFTIATSLGIDTILTREIAKDESKQNILVNTALSIKVVLSAIAITLVNAVAYFLYPNNVLRLAIAIRSLLLITTSITATLTAVFQAKLKIIYSSSINLASKLVFPAAVAAIIFTGGGYVQLIAASTLPFIIEAPILWLMTRRFLTLRLNTAKGIVKYFMKESWPIALSGVVYIVYTRTDMLMLSLMSTSESIGFYSAALNITEPIQFVTGGLSLVIFPVLARFYKKNERGFYRTFGLALKAATLVAAPITIVGISLNHEIINLVYGSQYSASGTAFSIMSIGAIFLSMNIIMGNSFAAVNRQGLSTIVVILGAILNVVLDYVLIRAMGFTGAALATLIVILFTSAVSAALLFRTINLRLNIMTGTKIAAAIAASIIAIHFTNSNLTIALAAGGAAYIATLLALRTFTREEYSLVKEIISLKTQAGKW